MHVARLITHRRASGELERAVQALRGKRTGDPRDPPTHRFARTRDLKRSIVQAHRFQRNIGGQERQARGGVTDPGPIHLAISIQSKAQRKLIQLDLAGLNLAAQQRRYRQRHTERARACRGGLEAAGAIRDADPLEANLGHRQDGEVDIALDPHGPTRELAGLGLEHCAVFVPVDDIRRGKGRGENDDQQRCDGRKQSVHESLRRLVCVDCRAASQETRQPWRGGKSVRAATRD